VKLLSFCSLLALSATLLGPDLVGEVPIFLINKEIGKIQSFCGLKVCIQRGEVDDNEAETGGNTAPGLR
jgi:hypothetical protein